MIRLVRAEFVKLRTTQVWFWLLMAALAISALIVIGSLASKHDVQDKHDVARMFAATNAAYVAVFVLGILGVTTEFRYQTITSTVLTTPSRWALVTAKMITYALVGIVYALLCLVLELIIAVPWLSAKNIDFSLTDPSLRHAIWTVLVVLALFGIVGLGVGALLRNQIVAVSVGVIFMLILENILLLIPGVKHIWPFLPGAASNAIIHLPGDETVFNDVHLLSLGGGIIALLLWAFIPAIIGAALTMNRDIT